MLIIVLGFEFWNLHLGLKLELILEILKLQSIVFDSNEYVILLYWA